MNTMIRQITHPGEPARDRITAQPCDAVPLRLTLRSGQSLSGAVPQALAAAGFGFGYLRIDGAVFAPLVFVTPAHAPDSSHAAWYSDTYTLSSPARVRHGGVHLGRRDGAPFLHCHAIWDTSDGLPDAGHLLCDDSILEQDCTVTGWGIKGAGLMSHQDPETNFSLFCPKLLTPTAGHNAFIVTLRPNQDITSALIDFTRQHDINRAEIVGIGSLVGTVFADGDTISSFATEILILSGHLKGRTVDLEVISVGLDGHARVGFLAPDLNAVCVTFEVMLLCNG
jgi:predicted DNA-binding protein with PD1-like motif